MIDYFIIHGSFGSPFQNWAPWLCEKLEEKNKSVLVPHFTADAKQNLSTWTSIMEGYAPLIGKSTCFIGHSLAPAFICDWFAEKDIEAGHFVAVAPFYGLINIPEFDAVNSTFFVDENHVTKGAGRFSKTTCVYSNNDPYVPIELSRKFVELSGGDEVLINGGGHLNSSAGFTTFPRLLDIIT